MKKLPIFLILTFLSACASPVSHFISEDDFNNHKKIELEVDDDIENKIDKTKINEFEEAIDSLEEAIDSLNSIQESNIILFIYGQLNNIDNMENKYNMFLEKKEQLNQELKTKEVYFNLDANTYYYQWNNKEEATEDSGLIFSTPDETIKYHINKIKEISKRTETLHLIENFYGFEEANSRLIFLEKEPKLVEFDYEPNHFSTNILTLTIMGNNINDKELEAKDIPEFNKKIKETNFFVYIEPNFYYTDGNIGEYQALKKLNSFKPSTKSTTAYSGTTTDNSGNFSVTIEENISTDYNDYNYNDTFLITGGLPDKTNLKDGIILKLNKVDRPKVGSKKYLIFDFVGYYNQKETQKLKENYNFKENPVIYANNNTFNNVYLTSKEMQKLTIAYNFSLTMLELNTLSKMFKTENEFFLLNLKEIIDLKEPASSLRDNLVNYDIQTVADSRTNFYNTEKRYLNQYLTYGEAHSTTCFINNNNYTDYSNCLENNAGKVSHYVLKPVSCLPFIFVFGIGYPICILKPAPFLS